MAALNFPDSPSVGQTFSAGGRTWQWAGATWDILTSGTANLPKTVNNQSASYALQAADKGQIVRFTGSSAQTLTVNNILDVGTEVKVIQDGTGRVNLAAGSGVTLAAVNGNYDLIGVGATANITCAASGFYYATGDLTSTKAVVSGGNAFSDATYYYRVFTGSGTLGITGASIAALDMLIIAGGGSSGFTAGGGGGAGGVIYASSKTLTAGSYPIVIGAGGAAALNDGDNGNSGTDSTFFGFTALGGGRGIHGSVSISTAGGSSGGVGYGNIDGTANAATQTSPSGATGYGNKGGDNINGGGAPYVGAGGGGAGGAGANVIDANNGGAGGAGLNTWASWATATSTGASGYYAGGGGGSAGSTQGSTAGGLGGGGTGGYAFGSAATNGIANTGGGGGGGSHTGTSSGGGSSGGSGIVIVRYLKTAATG